MARIWQSVCQMCCGRYILGVNEGACSIFGPGLKDLEGRMGSWCTMPEAAQETNHVRSNTPQHVGLTLGEKFKSLIIRFLLHRSS